VSVIMLIGVVLSVIVSFNSLNLKDLTSFIILSLPVPVAESEPPIFKK